MSNIVFMGTPSFAVPVLATLLDAGNELVGVYTQPDKPVGRGKKQTGSPIKEFALEHDLRVLDPVSLKPKHVELEMSFLNPDLVIVAAYGKIIPKNILNVPPLGSLNIHPSILPTHRGASPVPSTILSGERITGVSIMLIGDKVDSGPILAQRCTNVGATEKTDSLTERLFEIGASLLIEVLPQWTQGNLKPTPQDSSRATLTKRLTKKDGEISWNENASNIARQIRAYHPWPGTYTHWKGKLIKIIDASPLEISHGTHLPHGTAVVIPSTGLGITTGQGILAVDRLQLEGKHAVEAQAFLQGYPTFIGEKIGPK